ncbi:feruloyl esteras-like protein B precursor [Coniochaeta ligniaria NRRL 30616]|uniref:Carboxylic ester hydrolase n=1 Tax=Coniochaeta ligniaria NRRL 30616 TaxID=1408157 RepID=A0A1J7J4Q4_9PEZI|nr:feruloyl esteras-like protein B precursor [Coniochaeta ligniaria NRRL 30616]
MLLQVLLLPLMGASLDVLVRATACSSSCHSLTGLQLSNGTAIVVEAVPLVAGSNFTGSEVETSYNTPQIDLPSLCRVVLEVQTGGNNTARAEWNGRYLTVGNGGFAGSVNYPDIVWGARKGYATMSTNTGHNSTQTDTTWFLNHPERAIDWGHRALHNTTVAAKQVVSAYYHSDASYSYYAGCSTGGRQGLAAAERYPEDFDGVLVGSACTSQTHVAAWQTWIYLTQYPSNTSAYIPSSLWPVISAESMKQCDAVDGVADGVIMNPHKCDFHPEVLLCGRDGVNASACLNGDQLESLQRMYRPWVDGRGTLIFPGMTYGAEAGFSILMGGTTPAFGGTFWGDAVYNATFDWTQFSPGTVAFADMVNPGGANAYDPDLRPFEDHGGKVIQYHGFADPLIPATHAEEWYRYVNRFHSDVGRATAVDDFYRLFMVPGMSHCSGGVGAWVIDAASQGGITPLDSSTDHSIFKSLVDWVEGGRGPEKIVASHFVNNTRSLGVQFTRPLCRWPTSAVYSGIGDVNDADNWSCPTDGII